MTWKPIGEILIEEYGLPPEKFAEALENQEASGRPLGDILVGMRAIKPDVLARALAAQSVSPISQSLAGPFADEDLLDLVPISLRQGIPHLPAGTAGRPPARGRRRSPSIRGHERSGRPDHGEFIEVAVATPDEILRAINRELRSRAGAAQEVIEDIADAGDDPPRSGAGRPARCRRRSADHPLRQQPDHPGRTRSGPATSISSPSRRELIVRYRIDGILYEVAAAAAQGACRHHLAHQDHGRPEYRREAPPPGRPLPRAHRRQGRRCPRLDPADRLRRAGGAAPARQGVECPDTRGSRHGRRPPAAGRADDHARATACSWSPARPARARPPPSMPP